MASRRRSSWTIALAAACLSASLAAPAALAQWSFGGNRAAPAAAQTVPRAPTAPRAAAELARALPVPAARSERPMARCSGSDQKFESSADAGSVNRKNYGEHSAGDVLTAWGQQHFGDRAYCYIPGAEGGALRKPDWQFLFSEWQKVLGATGSGTLATAQVNRLTEEVMAAAQRVGEAAKQAAAAAAALPEEAPLWPLNSPSAQRTVFGMLELGKSIKMPACPTQPVDVSPPCYITMGRYNAHPEAGLTVNFVYLPSGLPGWAAPTRYNAIVVDCSGVLQSRLMDCMRERSRQEAVTAPQPHLVAVMYGQTVIEVHISGPSRLCESGFKAFQDKYGKPGFVNNDGSNATWTFDEFGVDILCNASFSPEPLREILGISGRPVARYTLTLRSAFSEFANAAQRRRQQEIDRAASQGPRL